MPNGLLEALGNGRFTVGLTGEVVERQGQQPAPLVIITTNDERELPAAFLRRCLVLTLALPKGSALVDHLVKLGRLHFPALAQAHDKVLKSAAEMLVDDRQQAYDAGVYQPGPAEYLDLLRAMVGLGGPPDVIWRCCAASTTTSNHPPWLEAAEDGAKPSIGGRPRRPAAHAAQPG